MSKSKYPSPKTLNKLACFAALLSYKELVPELSYFEVMLKKGGNEEYSVQVPFFLGAIEIMTEIDPQIWSRSSFGKDIDLSVDLKVNSFCDYFQIRIKDFCHFFSPENQNRDITDIILDHTSTCQDIAGVIFDYVICNHLMEYGKIVNMYEFLQLN
jgi:hypothetical protein